MPQLRKIDEQHKGEMGLLDDVQVGVHATRHVPPWQEFLKARAKLSMDYATGLSKLSQQVRTCVVWRMTHTAQFQSKRKWAATSYVEGHEKMCGGGDDIIADASAA